MPGPREDQDGSPFTLEGILALKRGSKVYKVIVSSLRPEHMKRMADASIPVGQAEEAELAKALKAKL